MSSKDYLMQKQIIEGADRRNNEQNYRQENIINKGKIATMDQMTLMSPVPSVPNHTQFQRGSSFGVGYKQYDKREDQ